MPKSEFNYDSIWEYLDDIGILENGSPTEITAAKQKYWVEYRKYKKQESRKDRPELNISFVDKKEKQMFRDLAKKHEKPLSVFIKEAALGYIENRYVQVNEAQWVRVIQELSMIRIAIQQIAETSEKVSYFENYSKLLDRIMEMEQRLKEVLNNPPLLESAIETAIQQEPWRKNTLIKHIQSL